MYLHNHSPNYMVRLYDCRAKSVSADLGCWPTFYAPSPSHGGSAAVCVDERWWVCDANYSVTRM